MGSLKDQKIADALRKQAANGSPYAAPRNMNTNFGHSKPVQGFPSPKVTAKATVMPDWLTPDPAKNCEKVDNVIFPFFPDHFRE